MKKTVKSLIIAASVAAIAGIGAVSFAAWNATAPTEVDVDGSTATIVTTAGEIKVTNDNLASSALLPWDQVVQLDAGETMHTFTVSYDKGTGADVSSYAFTMTVENDDNLPLYYQIGSSVTASDPTAEGSDWKELTGEIALDLSSDQTVNIILHSNSYENHGNGKAYTVTISATAATADAD